MPKGTILSDLEKGQILAFKEEGRSNKWISRRINRSPIENVWALLVKSVYSNGRQFNNVNDLKSAIKEAWEGLDQNHIASVQ